MGGNEQQFCLRWNNHQSTLISVFEALLESETLVDVTLAAEGRYLKAHKVVLCACSPFFQDLLSNHLEKYPIIVLKDVTFQELKALIDYMYRGEVNVSQEQLAALIKTAESLKIKGLADGGDKNKKSSSSSTTPAALSPAPPPPPPSLPAPLPPSALPPNIAAEAHHSPVNNIREGSMSPISRKRRKRSRRRSGDSLEPESVDSSLSEPPLALERGGGERCEEREEPTNKERVIRALGLVPPSALLGQTTTGLLEPKAEVEDIDEESVDLMLDEETSEDKAREADARPGPSHEGLQAASGFPPWHLTPERGGGGDDLSISAVGGDGGGSSASHENRDYEMNTKSDQQYLITIVDDDDDLFLNHHQQQQQQEPQQQQQEPQQQQEQEQQEQQEQEQQEQQEQLQGQQEEEELEINYFATMPVNVQDILLRPHQCTSCGKRYRLKTTLTRHQRYECGGACKSLQCPVCHRRCSRPDNLKQHLQLHEEEPAYKKNLFTSF